MKPVIVVSGMGVIKTSQRSDVLLVFTAQALAEALAQNGLELRRLA